MDRLTSMTVFARVATARSFSAAARELGISQATASKHVQTLESSLGTRLLHRTTRRVGLTDAGMNFYAQCLRILDDMENAWQAGTSAARLRGNVRIVAPVTFGSMRLAPVLAEFMRQYPEVSVTADLMNRPVDVVEERWDLAIRVSGTVPEGPGFSARTLMPLRFVLCAAPSYVQAAGTPATPAALSRLTCLLDDGPRVNNVWRFKGPNGPSEVVVNGRLRTNSTLIRLEAARAGAGVLLAPEFLVAKDLASGRLVRLLADYEPDHMLVFAIWPTDRMSPRLDRLVAFLVERLGPHTAPGAVGAPLGN